jgi:hypothetical protein
MICQIRVKGHLAPHWAGWFDDLSLTLEDNGETLLSGTVADQAALHGVLRRVRDLALPLVSVVCSEPGQTSAPGARGE